MLTKFTLICLLFTASILPQNITGSGSAADPYVLYNTADFDSIRYLGSNHFALGADLDFTSWGEFTPFATGWMGELDGRGHTISNIDLDILVSASTQYQAIWSTWESNTAVFNDTVGVKNLYIDSPICTDSMTATGTNWAAILVGIINAGAGSHVVNVHISNPTVQLKCPNTEPIRFGAITGQLIESATGSSGDQWITYCSLDTATITLYNGSAAQAYVGGLVGNFSEGLNYHSHMNRCWVNEITITGVRTYDYLGGLIGYMTADEVYDCYAMNVSIYAPGTTITSMHAGPLIGDASSTLTADGIWNCYVVGDVNHPGINDANTGGIFGGLADTADVMAGTIFFNDDSTASAYDYTQGQVDPGYLGGGPWNKTTAWLKDTTNLISAGWDFDNVWYSDINLNYGFPQLEGQTVWFPPILTYPNTLQYFVEGDTVTITWTPSTDTSSTNTFLYWSSNGGSTWIPLDTLAGVTDSTWDWVIPGVNTSQGKVKVAVDGTYLPTDQLTDSSDANFWILTASDIDILYPIQVASPTLAPGDTAHIIFTSQFVDSVDLFWSHDSVTWYLIEANVAVDTVNGAFVDTSTYIWTFPANIVGPTLYGRITEEGDTTLFYFNREYVDHGYGYPHDIFVCQTDSGGRFIYHKYFYDPSCGWSSPTKGWDIRLLDDDGLGHTYVHTHCSLPYTGCTFDTPAPVYLFNVTDTTAIDLNDYYTYGDSIDYLGRTYYVKDSLLLCNDNINGISEILVSDLSVLYGGAHGWVSGSEMLQLYHVQRSKISGEYLDEALDLTTLNDSWFKARIIVGSVTGQYPNQTISVEALPYPNDPVPAVENEILYINAKVYRYHFRGIHPKAEKR